MTSVKGWYTGRLWSMTLSASRRTVVMCFSLLFTLLQKTLSSVCVCVCAFSSHSFWTSSSLDVPAGVTQEEGHTGFLIHLLSAVRAHNFSREKGSAVPFPRRP